MKKILGFGFLFVLVSGCSLTYRVLLGIDSKPEWSTDAHIAKRSEKYKIPQAYGLVLDTASYARGLQEIYTAAFDALANQEKDSLQSLNLDKALNDDHQPAQFRMFDSQGTEIFKLVNCYIDPPIPLNWNVDKCFESFPPKTSIETLNIHQFDLDFLLSHSKFVNQTKLAFTDLPEADYYGVILWNDFFERPSRRLIKNVRNYLKNMDKNVVLIYINNQNQYLWSVVDFETKEKISALYE